MNIPTGEALWHHPALGRSWEGFVLEEIIRREKIQRPHTQFYFWRTAAGAEADMVLDRGDTLIAMEIKCGALERTIEAKRFAANLSDIGAAQGFVLDLGCWTSPIPFPGRMPRLCR